MTKLINHYILPTYLPYFGGGGHETGTTHIFHLDLDLKFQTLPIFCESSSPVCGGSRHRLSHDVAQMHFVTCMNENFKQSFLNCKYTPILISHEYQFGYPSGKHVREINTPLYPTFI